MSRSLGTNAEIQEQVAELGKQNTRLERMLAKLGTKGDTVEFRGRLEKDLKSANQLAKRLLGLLGDTKNLRTQSDKQMTQKLTRDFAVVFERYQELHEQIKAKDKVIMRAMNEKEKLAGRSRPGTPPDDDYEGRGRGSSGGGRDELSEQLLMEEAKIEFTEYDVEEIEDRHKRIVEIERDVMEVSEMFKDLKLLVDEQDEKITTIADNISSTKDQTIAAHGQLVQAEVLQSKARSRKCCLLFIILGILAGIVLTSILAS